ncbi:hypothetical protein GCM10010174_62940 [Kutzneria viridogrisea]|uniref:Uncharacterized protein n=2 Tax=Kutzneria TaxID=43356 RepID=W5WIR3_9PSEU|nr:hypothetical protein [Kutzneria albida]AHI00616.1 hypothetical protein KALB_7258 [Kutzneria albida DSM 43870]MBA8925795.1 hypothetical protein [Kutzneria viridogrisea]
MRIEMVVLTTVAVAALSLAWWLTSPRFIGWLVARRLRKLRTAARSLYPMLTVVVDPSEGIVVVNRAEPSPLPTQRCAESPPGEAVAPPVAPLPRD